jgi:hypothetical protein
MFRQLRIFFLLLILLFVALGTWLDRARTTSWDRTLWVAVYPIAADSNSTVDAYIGGLSVDTFAPIAEFVRREAERYNVKAEEPVRVLLYDRLEEMPPALKPGTGFLGRALWSLRLRYWAWGAGSEQKKAPPHIKVFVLYHDPAVATSVPHSVGLQKGLVGVVHAFADARMTGANNVVIAHELLHTLGALDKYGPDNRPIFPFGYADPEQNPRYPQARTEIMAGRRMLSESDMDMPENLSSVVVGPQTAREIGWTK